MDEGTGKPWTPRGDRARRQRRQQADSLHNHYRNYQHGRFLSGLLVFFAVLIIVASFACLLDKPEPGREQPALVWLAMMAFGFAGVVGGVATYLGNRELHW